MSNALKSSDDSVSLKKVSAKAFGMELTLEDFKPPHRFLGMCLGSAALLLIGWICQTVFSTPPWIVWSMIGVSATPILVSLITDYFPSLDAKRRVKRVEKLASEGIQDMKRGFFRLRPYENSTSDRLLYDRPDGLHNEVLPWLVQVDRPLLYLTGNSGCGKSSMLNAYVLPELEERYGVRVIEVRSYENALEELRYRLRHLVEELNLYSQEPTWLDEAPVDEAARRVLARWKPTSGGNAPPFSLLIVFDQFEELIILNEYSPETVRQTRDVLKRIEETPILGMKVLVSLRADYDHMLESELQLPPIFEKNIHRKVGAFTRAQAAKILGDETRTGCRLSSEELDHVLAEAAIVDENRGMVRPIVINLIGLILNEHEGKPLPLRPEGRLLLDDIRTSLKKCIVHEHAEEILKELLSDADTKRPRSVAQLAEATGLPLPVIEGTLNQLWKEDLVRVLNSKEENRTQRVWEISHDFVASLIARVLRTPEKKSLTGRIRPHLSIASLVFALGLTLFVVLAYGSNKKERLKSRLNDLGVIINPLEGGGWRARIDSGNYVNERDDWNDGPFKEESMDRVLPLLQRYPDIIVVDFDECSALKSFKLSQLPNLRHLELTHCRNLKTLILSHVDSLTELEIGGCPALTELPDLETLPNLVALGITPAVAAQRWEVRDLDSLKSLRWWDVSTLEDLPQLENLRELDIGLPPFGVRSNRKGEIQDFTPLKQYPKLEVIHVYGLSELEKSGILSVLPGIRLDPAEDRNYRYP